MVSVDAFYHDAGVLPESEDYDVISILLSVNWIRDYISYWISMTWLDELDSDCDKMMKT